MRPSTSLSLTSNDLATGFHYGIRNDSTSQDEFLVVAAGGTVYDLVQIGPGTTYQVVMQLDVNPSGDDFLTAWYVPEGSTALTTGLTATNVGNIFQTTSDLNQLIAQVDSGPVLGPGLTGLTNTFDEVRFGTSLSDVVPEPGSFLLLSASGLALVLSRRRCRR